MADHRLSTLSSPAPHSIHIITIRADNHFFDIFDDREIAEPPDFTEKEPLEESMSTELGALLGKSTLFSFKNSSISGPKSGKSYPKFLYK